MEEAALQQMIAYSFIGGPEKIKKELEIFLEKTQVNELMVATAVYEHEARLVSYKILSQLKTN
jgi:alkanesulfonate monooxygenase SsuD/methylene tetrahydromethanopterin reductase-like flavin-dependent oxidoreductase (luciferase family)